MNNNDIIDAFTLKLINGESDDIKKSIQRLYLGGFINNDQLCICVGWLISLFEYNEIIEGT